MTDARRRSNQKWYESNRAHVKVYKAGWAKKHPEKARANRLKYRYGLTVVQFNALYVAQGGRCAICKDPIEGRGVHIDHCHKSGKVRGLLCGGCNHAIGFLFDSPDRANAVAKYLGA